VVATCRLVPGGGVWRLGRMAVRRDRRGEGLGAAVLLAAHREAARGGARAIHLAAQTPVRDFYARYGYVPRGDVFIEAGIPHVMMGRTMEGAAE